MRTEAGAVFEALCVLTFLQQQGCSRTGEIAVSIVFYIALVGLFIVGFCSTRITYIAVIRLSGVLLYLCLSGIGASFLYIWPFSAQGVHPDLEVSARGA